MKLEEKKTEDQTLEKMYVYGACWTLAEASKENQEESIGEKEGAQAAGIEWAKK